MDQPTALPNDPMFFTETALGLIATARSIIMAKAEEGQQPQNLLDVLNVATHRAYSKELSQVQAQFLVQFVRAEGQDDALLHLGRTMTTGT